MDELTSFGRMAKQHWKTYRPRMYQRLEESGMEMEALLNNQENAEKEMVALLQRGHQAQAAREYVLSRWIILPEEKEYLSPDFMPYDQPT